MQKQKTKLYKNGKLFYEGECQNGIPNGYGIKYLPSGRKYEGYLKNNLLHGKGKLYNAEGKLIYEGDFKEDNAEGNGICYLTDRKIIGEFSKGSANGNCILCDLYSHVIFKGIYKDGQPYKGIIFNHSDSKEYEGYIKNKKYDGYGILYYTYNGKKKYEGNFKEGKFKGLGKEYEDDGKLVREGEYSQGKFIKGYTFIYDYSYKKDDEFDCSLVKIYVDKSDSNDYKSSYDNKGIHYDKNDKKIFEGKIVNGKYYQGKLYNGWGYLIYDGYFKDNKYSDGKLYKGYGENHMIYHGHFFEGKYSGQGEEYDYKYGVLEYIGGFKNGERHGCGTLYPGAKSVHYINGMPD